jgi:glycosyltransferase involved in cell wall biosynthesis
MHILFLTDNFPPEVNAPATRTYEHCREWVKRGHKVTVITGAPNFPTGRLYPGYRNRWRSRETMDGIEVVRVWTYITANEGFIKRTLDFTSFMASAIPAGLGVRDIDVIVATSPQLFTPCAAFLVGLLKQRPYVFELRDLWPESIRAVGAMTNGRVLRGLEALELFLYRRAAHVVSVTHAFKANLVSRGVPPEKISVTTNGVDRQRFAPMPRDEALAAQLGLTGKTVVGYIGTHGMAHSLGTVLNAAAKLKEDPASRHIRFLFLGNGAEKPALQRMAAEYRLDNVLFLDSVPRDEVARHWSLLDLAVIHLRRTPLFETVIPSKLFECMAMGIPVLHGVAGESARLVTQEGCGMLFEAENPHALATAVRDLAADPDRRAEFSRRGRQAAGRYDRSSLAAEMLQVLLPLGEATAALATNQSPTSAR